MTVKWGVIGAGGIADRRTIPEMVDEATNSELVAVMDIDEGRAKAVAEKYGVARCYSDEDSLLNDDEVQAVYIATPQHLHCTQVIKAARCGKHVFCEKPMAVCLAECEEMISECQKNGVKLMLGYTMRYNVYNQKAKELVDNGVIGQLVMGRAQLTCWYPPIPGAWRQNINISHGGSLIDMGSHCIDLLETIFGKAVEVSAFQSRLTHDYSIEDTSVIMLRFESGALGVVDNFFNIPDSVSRNFMEIYGTKGSILAAGTIGQEPTGELILRIQDQGGYDAEQTKDQEFQLKEYKLEPKKIYASGIRVFSECIENDTEPPITGEDGMRNLRVILAAYESAKEGKTIRI